MNSSTLERMLSPFLRRNGSRRRPAWLVAIVFLVVGYSVARPWLNDRYGWHLPDVLARDPAGPAASPPASQPHVDPPRSAPSGEPAAGTEDEADAILAAFAAQRSDVLVQTRAEVARVLPDDNVGSRHQKAILRLASGHTILLAHNIDLAERVPFDQGDVVEVKGEYEYTEQGGVIHWTHHDPGGRHPGGWIKHEGATYE